MTREPWYYGETLTEQCIVCAKPHTYTCDPLVCVPGHLEAHLTCSQECAEEYARIQYEDWLENERRERGQRGDRVTLDMAIDAGDRRLEGQPL